ncbi:hypothetical protein GGU45_004019 [Niabella hirudinis]
MVILCPGKPYRVDAFLKDDQTTWSFIKGKFTTTEYRMLIKIEKVWPKGSNMHSPWLRQG